MTDTASTEPSEHDELKPPFKDPKPSVERIAQLAGRVLTGDILLPKFQRDFVWPKPKIIKLLDSIAKNYPIGIVLLWQSKQPLASERTIAGLSIADTKPDYPVNYLLDGQQRLSTLCGALYWKPNDDPKSLWNIVYDLRNETFQHLETLDDPPLSKVPMRYLADPATFFKRMAALDNEELRDRGDALFNRLQNYMIAAVTLGDMSVNDIAPIFERINSTGTPLTIVDLMRAATWSPEFDLRDSIDEVLSELEPKQFDTVDQKTMLRAVSAAAGFGFAAEDMDRLREMEVTDLKKVLDEVAEAAKRTVDFLRSHVRVPRIEALPYANQFPVLVELFRLSKPGNARDFSAAETWFWRTTLGGYFGGWNTGQMSRDYKAIHAFAEKKSDEIELTVTLPSNLVWRGTQFRANSSLSKMLALMLANADPLDLLTGERIDLAKSLSWSTDREFHHFFPKEFLKSNGVSNDLGNAIANIVLLTSASNIAISKKAPSVYLAEIESVVGRDELVRRAASCLVSEDALDFALADNFVGFLIARSTHLTEIAKGLAKAVEPGDLQKEVTIIEGQEEDRTIDDD